MRLLIGNVPFSVAHYVEPACGGTPRSDRRSLAPFAVVFELRQSPLHWNNRGCKVFSVVATQTAKPSALRSKRLCLVPSVLFSRTASGGCRNWLVKQCGYFHIHPKRPSRGSRGTPSPDAVMIAFTQLCSRSALRFLQNVTVWPDFLNRRRDSNTDDDGFLRTDKMREKQKWRREFYSAMRCGGLLRRSCRSYCTLTAIGSTLALKLMHRPALAAQSVDPTILHAHRQRWQDDMPLP